MPQVALALVIALFLLVFLAIPVFTVTVGGVILVDMACFVHFARADQRCPIVLLAKVDNPMIQKIARDTGAVHILARPYVTPALTGQLEDRLGLNIS